MTIKNVASILVTFLFTLESISCYQYYEHERPYHVCEYKGQVVYEEDLRLDDFQHWNSTCRCEHGVPVSKCRNDIQEFCRPDGCYENYKFNENVQACVPNVCKCPYGKATLLCSSEERVSCHPEGCYDGFFFDEDSKICTKPSNSSSTCNKFEHYVLETNSCEPNVCHCSYGMPTDKCYDHDAHDCRATSCIPNTVPVDGEHGIECTKTCENHLSMDSKWIRLRIIESEYRRRPKDVVNRLKGVVDRSNFEGRRRPSESRRRPSTRLKGIVDRPKHMVPSIKVRRSS